MADVGTSGRRESRAQLILVTALGLAILFVTLALIVNTAIYTENLATRGSDIGGGTEAVRYYDAVRTGTGGVMEYANYHENGSHAFIRTELNDGVDALDNRTGRLFAMSDRGVTVKIDGTVNGTRVYQTNGSRNYTDVDGNSDWTVAQDIDHVRAFRMNVSRDQLVGAGSDAFEVVLEDGGGTTWTVSVSTPGSDIVVTINGPTVSDSCTAAGAEQAWVNVTAGSHNGSECDPLLSIAEGLSTPYEVRFANSDNVTGTYTLIVDDDALADSPGLHLMTDGSVDQPYATHAVYSTNLTVVYQTPQLYFNATARVAPEEADG